MDNSQQQLEYQVEESVGSNLSKIPAMIAGAIVCRLAFSLFFAVFLIPLEI
jgi:hypothetical protein